MVVQELVVHPLMVVLALAAPLLMVGRALAAPLPTVVQEPAKSYKERFS